MTLVTMMFGSLTKSGTSMLIREVKNRPCLWDPSHEDYNVRSRTLMAWKSICRVMGNDFTVDFAKMRWKCIKDTFRRECKKFDTTDLESYRGKWQYFRKMWFLKKSEPASKTTDQDNESEEENTITCKRRIKRESSYEEDAVYLEEINDDNYPNSGQDDFSAHDNRTIVNVDPIPDERREYANNSDDEDYDMMFLKSLLPFFKNLDPMRKLVLRSKIQTLLVEEIAGTNKK